MDKVNESPIQGQEEQANRRIILVVDDDSINAQIAAGAFDKMENVEAVVLTDSAEAKEFLRTHHIDALISDLQMPDVTGLELAEIAKERGIGRIVVMSGRIPDDEAINEKIAQIGAIGLGKPFHLEELRRIVVGEKAQQ